jgi:hypothetical protein
MAQSFGSEFRACGWGLGFGNAHLHLGPVCSSESCCTALPPSDCTGSVSQSRADFENVSQSRHHKTLVPWAEV